jgi:hypothetical protein
MEAPVTAAVALAPAQSQTDKKLEISRIPI